jgi:hypothetical protein
MSSSIATNKVGTTVIGSRACPKNAWALGKMFNAKVNSPQTAKAIANS